LINLFRNPVQSLGWIKLEKVRAVALPESIAAFFPDNSVAAIDNILIRL